MPCATSRDLHGTSAFAAFSASVVAQELNRLADEMDAAMARIIGTPQRERAVADLAALRDQLADLRERAGA